MKLYVIGALKNRSIIGLAKEIRELGFDVFDDWISPGEAADEKWQEYERERGRSYQEALGGRHAEQVFEYDVKHLSEADIVVMAMPCGKSGHLEFGWSIGQGKKGFILFDEEPERYDLMYKFADGIYFDKESLFKRLKREVTPETLPAKPKASFCRCGHCLRYYGSRAQRVTQTPPRIS